VTHSLRSAAVRALVPLGYLALAIAVSWPLARDFATYTIGDITYDERHAIWLLWYTAQALAGRVSWPDTTYLLWPHGISVLVDGVGPLNGIAALPFWPWGPAAAFNGAVVVGLTLSGWALYALARGIGLERGPAFVAGLLYLLWPMHLIGLNGHLERMFLGMLPLTLLAGLRAFDPGRPRLWLAAPGVALLGALLQNGNQFTFAALGLGLLGVQTWWAAPADERARRLPRMIGAGALSLAICGPLLFAIVRVMRDPALQVSLGEVAFYYAPDALSLVLPAPHQWWAAWLYPDPKHVHDWVWASTLSGLNPTPIWYGTGVETAVTIPLTAMALGAWSWRARTQRAWILFGLAFVALCLGPRLRVDGVVTPVRLPFVVAKRIPGLDVMRTPGRYMFMGAVGFALAAGVGLSALARRHPARATALVTAAGVLAAVECWPRPWTQSALPRVPAFYRQLAADRSGGAVFDLPTGVNNIFASAYMYYQTIHHRPIAWSYLSRAHLRYPNAGLEGIWVPEAPGGPALRARLRALGYRYVVVHRYPWIFLDGTVADGRIGEPWATPLAPDSERLIREAFRGEAPVHEDDLVTVWIP
jgi:hypothetical protein